MNRIVLVIIIIVISSLSLAAVELESPVFRGVLLFLGNSDDATGASPSPLLNPVGFSLPIRFSEYICVEPAMYFYGTWYGFSDSTDRPVPFSKEWREAWVLSFLFDPAFVIDVPVTEKINLGFSASPGFRFRFPVFAYDADIFDSSVALNYFFSAGRFFYPKAGLYFTWMATERIRFRFQADTWFPLYHAWDEDAQPFWDGLIVMGSIGFSFIPSAK